ncbi:unnamed protein product [Bursaphelenchus xylophilus]|uniref:(pine wood nematode) hypothetical protein n=1 Tax=Bursaphelenchus xylophilus TaxID=6326 RepID=A0A1I7SLX3_BURXY|nr:unnamed protein product [Bursaphelenchus xylophilus]CAG9129902.1 unnamed protein product [Bursaphelenchus xylophilus]
MMVPLVYVLMRRKNRSSYRRVLEALQMPTAPERVIMDFEMASKQAIQDVYGSHVAAHGCHFHFCQCLKRKVDEFAKQDYKNNSIFARFIRHLMALPFAKPEHIEHYFEQLLIKFRDLLGNDATRLLIPMKDYMERTWIGLPGLLPGDTRQVPLFEISFWNCYEYTTLDLPRTNNNIEAWHRAIQETIRQKHPTIEALIKALKQEEGIANLDIAHANGGDVPPFIRRKVYYSLNERFKKVLEAYNPDPLIFLGGIVQNIRQ